MNKQAKKKSVAEIIQLFKIDPEQAYQELISSSQYFHTKQSKKFWEGYIKLDIKSLNHQFSDSTTTFNRVVWLKLFYELKEFYDTEKAKNITGILSLNPDETSLIKSLFLSLELGDITQNNVFPNYNEESLEAIKILLSEIFPKLKRENKAHYSPELARYSNNLIKIQIDLALLAEFVDTYVWANFEIQQKENAKGFKLQLPDHTQKEENSFILNYLKTEIRRDYQRKESHPKISEEEHFKQIDPKWKTNEGLLGVIHSSGVVIKEQPPGITSLQVNDSLFEGIHSDDLKIRETKNLEMMQIMMEQNFHFQFRNALSEIYQPNDEVDIHALQLELKNNVFVSLFDLICVMSCLIAKADVFRCFSDFPNESIKAVKNQIQLNLKSKHPEYTPEQLDRSSNSFFIQHLTEIEKRKDITTFIFVEHETILNWLKKIEEMKTKSDEELNAMIDLIANITSPLPFNPLYKIDDKYYFSYLSCSHKFNLNRLLYDNYISDKLFNPNNKPSEKKPLVEETQKGREIRFTNSLKDLFKTFTPFVDSGLEYGHPKLNYDFGNLRGDFDVIAYFEKENIILPIQVKLSNVSPRTEKRKKEWIVNRIEKKGIEQVKKDIKLLETKSGLEFIANKLNIKSEIKQPLIYPLIVTDNFFADHVPFIYNEKKEYVLCVSYFELKHLILNQKIHDKQPGWLPFEPDKAASLLINAIEKNFFWSFLEEYAKEFRLNKFLCAINEDFKIQMTV